MKIGIILPRFAAHKRDWVIPVYQHYVRELAKEHSVRVFPISYPEYFEPYQLYGAYVFPMNVGLYHMSEGYWKAQRRLEQNLINHHETDPFDVLHSIGAGTIGYITNRLSFQINIPSVISLSDGELVGYQNLRYGAQRSRVISWLVYHSIKYATQLIAPSQTASRTLLSYIQYHDIHTPERMQVVPLGVDTDMFRLPQVAMRPRQFLHVGRLEPVKRQDILLHLLAKMPGTTLDIVGSGSLQEYLLNLARQLRIEDRVQFHGKLPYDEMPKVYQSAQYLLVTSQYEVFSMPAIEAMACGTGILGTAVGVLPELTTTAPVGDMEWLLATIVSRKRTRRATYYQQNRQKILDEFTIQQMVERTLAVYEQALMIGR